MFGIKVFMVVLIIFNALEQIVYARPIDDNDPKNAVITNYEFVRGDSNDYKFGFDTSDGTSRQEQGGSDASSSLATSGSVSWVAQDGSRYQMFFKADTRGFRPIIKRISGP